MLPRRVRCKRGMYPEGAAPTHGRLPPVLCAGVSSEHEVRMRCAGKHLPLCSSAAAAVAGVLGIPLSAAAHRLCKFKPAPMRMELREAGARTILLDAYNANPASVLSALQLLAEIPGAEQRVALLGDMAELGAMEEQAHRDVLVASLDIGLDIVAVAGAAFRRAAETELPGGEPHPGPTELLVRDTPQQLAEAVGPRLAPSAAILVKGSRKMGMEALLDSLPL
mmetsp:Transcript_45775/g.115756  ORF Transcript_45775/g.115756 Transcript_45775/m.115756 type:complete len:223 (-) Transcript_45775:1665-2333(-)